MHRWQLLELAGNECRSVWVDIRDIKRDVEQTDTCPRGQYAPRYEIAALETIDHPGQDTGIKVGGNTQWLEGKGLPGRVKHLRRQ